jgi:hypothetical protein
MPTIAEQIAALEAEALVLEAEAKAAEPTADELALAAARERATAARQTKGAHAALRRSNDMAARLAAARTRVPSGTMLQGVDLVALFPLDSPPPADKLPNGGVIIVRNPDPTVESNLLVELEHKNGPRAKLIDALLIDLLCKSVVDPDVSAADAGGAEGTKLQAFCAAFPAAAVQAAGVARRLGGAKAQEAKRGRE